MSDGVPVIAPVQEAERIDLLDALRGFAVLGILLANIPYMAMAGAMTDHTGVHIGSEAPLDYACWGFVYLFADTKFITIFSTLFGAGLALMSEKAIARDGPFVPRYLRRLAVLFLFGLAHIVLLWFGDILLFYSVVGCIAIWFRKCRVRTLLWWSGVLLVLNGLVFAALGIIDPAQFVDPGDLSVEEYVEKITRETRESLSSGNFVEMAKTRIGFYASSAVFFVLWTPRTLALFLIGIALVKSGVLVRVAEVRERVFRWMIGSLSTGIPLGAVAVYAQLENDSGGAIGTIALGSLYFGGLLTATGYVCAFMLWCTSDALPALRRSLAAVGRMALTNYISHSLITSIVFNYCGQFDTWRRPHLLALVFAIFAFQLVASPLWLDRFRFGPLEWLWRSATYWRLVPMRR